jgi:hypothetical protein
MSSSSLLRSSGLAAVLGGVLLIIGSLVQLVLNLFFLSSGTVGEVVLITLYVRAAVELFGHALLALGLVGLYVRQSGATGTFGLISFLAVFVGMMMPAGFELGAVLTDLGWVLFGVATLRARVYPRVPTVLLIVASAVLGVFDHLAAPMIGAPGGTLVYASVTAEIVRNVVIVWLGYSLFSERDLTVERHQLAR